MLDNKKVVAIIPARAGSKSIPNKNIRLLAEKPLIAWSIDEASKSKYLDRIFVSTDGAAISTISEDYGAEVLRRPSALAGDDSLVIDTIRSVIEELRNSGYRADYVILLEPTSPLRLVSDIDGLIEKLILEEYDSVATFREAELNPHRAWKIDNGKVQTFIDGATPWLPRQQQPEAWQLNGAVYGFAVETLPIDGVSILFGKIGSVIMPHERSLDIDNRVQFMLAEGLLRERNHDKNS
jgi:CMP-N,N'-diacetyllegionaminic acid synthase